MSDDGSIVHTPLEGECLAQYLQRFSDAEIQEISSNNELMIQFCRVLQESFKDFEHREDGLEKLWKIISHANDLDRLLYFIRRLEPTRRYLLESLADQENEMRRVSKLCTIGRLAGSSFDIAGTIVGLWMRDSRPSYADLAFRVATASGLLAFVSTVSEMSTMKSSFDNLIKLIRRDQELLAPIQRWYQRTTELEEAMQTIFPFDVTNYLVAEFADIGHSEITPYRLFATLLRSIAETDFRRLRDENLIRNLINFTLYPASQDWLEWIIFSRHPVILDITRIILQLQNSPFQFLLCQNIPALNIADQNIVSLPVWGRVSLNLVTIVQAINTLRRSDVSTVASEISNIRRHLQSEMTSLRRIVEFVELRRKKR